MNLYQNISTEVSIEGIRTLQALRKEKPSFKMFENTFKFPVLTTNFMLKPLSKSVWCTVPTTNNTQI